MRELHIKTFRKEIRDRANQMLDELISEIKERAITEIRDSHTRGIYCNMFLLDDGVRVRAILRDGDALSFELENSFEQGVGSVDLADIRSFGEGAMIEVAEWLDNVLKAIDKGILAIRDGSVGPASLLCRRVRWHDPAIADFQPEDRAAQESRVYTVVDEDLENDTVLIKDEYGEAEVYVSELEEVDRL